MMGGAKISTAQRQALQKLDGLQATAGEIDVVVRRDMPACFGAIPFNSTTRKTFNDVTNWQTGTIGTGTFVFDNSSSYHKYGTQTIRFGNTQAGGTTLSSMKITLDQQLDLSGVDFFSCWVFLDNQAVLDTYSGSAYGSVMLVAGDNAFVNSSGAKINGGASGCWHKGWNNVTIKKSDFDTTISGSGANWTNIKAFQIRVDADVGASGTLFHLDSFFMGGSTKAVKTPVCITLDDSHKNSIILTNIMNTYGVPVTLFVMDEYIDNHVDYLTKAELTMLYKQGNDVGIHGAGLNEFVTTPLRMQTASNWCMSNGFTRNDCHLYGSYPNGSYNQATIDYAINIGIKGLRAILAKDRSDTDNIEAYMGCQKSESILNGGIADPYRIVSNKPTTSAAYISELNTAILRKTAYLTYHHLISEVGTVAEWETIAKYLKTKIDDGTIECLTFPQLCRKYESI